MDDVINSDGIVHRTLSAFITKRHLWLFQIVYSRAKRFDSATRKHVRIAIGDTLSHTVFSIPLLPRGIKGLRDLLSSIKILKVEIPDNLKINNHVHYTWVDNDGEQHQQPIFFKNNKFEKNTRLYYLPFSGLRFAGKATHLRRTQYSSLVYVCRPIYSQENSFLFNLFENKFVSWLFYCAGKAVNRVNSTKTIVFYEKFASKAEEGAFELFQTLQKQTDHKSYFVLDKNSKDFLRVGHLRGVIPKFSLSYYWRTFTADLFVGTEVPTHISLLRSNNYWLRRKLYSTPYVFLQHGIIFLKNLGRTSVYVRGREGEPEYIIASSEKEKQVIRRDLHLSDEKVLVTGLGQFDLIDYKTIHNESPDVITVLFTWRPYDEHLKVVENTKYYEVLVQTLQVLDGVFDETEIRVVIHPKFSDYTFPSNISDRIWKSSVSSALEGTKLLITDYSSVCYNVFYRGAAVLFFQPDLSIYEESVGELVPEDNEFIGFRVFNQEQLRITLQKAIMNEKIILTKLRTTQHESIYSSINEFSDGKNISRIANSLIRIIEE